MQTARRSADDHKVYPKRPGKGGRRCGFPKQRNEAIDSPTARIEAGGVERGAERGTKTNRQKEPLTERKADEIRTNAEGKCSKP